MNDLEIARRKRQRKIILRNWDEIAQGLREGKSFNLEEFVPSDEFRKAKNMNIEKTLENKSKL